VEHLDENQLIELVEQRVTVEARARIQRHLDTCEGCREMLGFVASASPSLGPTEVDLSRHLRASALAPGEVLGGRFTLEREVGEGGMGVVWAARDEAGAPVAVKILKEVSAAERRRFQREARLMQSFDHPGILDVREVVAVGDEGDVFLVMDLLAGESLGGRLGRVGRLTVEETVGVARPLVDALAVAHARGVVHRDVKPENVFLCTSGRVVLLDFGMAKLTGALDLAVSGWMTESGLILGTPHYMAPEQIYGERDVDARADVWSLGVVLYECLTGERPVSGKSFGQLVRALQRREIADLSSRRADVPSALAELVRSMLSIDRAERPTLGTVARALAP